MTINDRFLRNCAYLPAALIMLAAGAGTLPAAERNFLIAKDAQIKIYSQPAPDAPFRQIPRLSVLEITGTETMHQRSWNRVLYIDMGKSAVRDTTGYIEIAPDLKDIVPVSSLRNAVIHLSLNPPVSVPADLMELSWQYTGDMIEDVQKGASEDDEIIKEYYSIICRLFVPEKQEGIILDQPSSYYHAFSEEDAIRRVKAVTAHPEWAGLFREKILSGFITEQMSRDMVRASWGDPRSIAKGVPQVWLYGTDAKPVRVSFVKGRVSAWEQ